MHFCRWTRLFYSPCMYFCRWNRKIADGQHINSKNAYSLIIVQRISISDIKLIYSKYFTIISKSWCWIFNVFRIARAKSLHTPIEKQTRHEEFIGFVCFTIVMEVAQIENTKKWLRTNPRVCWNMNDHENLKMWGSTETPRALPAPFEIPRGRRKC